MFGGVSQTQRPSHHKPPDINNPNTDSLNTSGDDKGRFPNLLYSLLPSPFFCVFNVKQRNCQNRPNITNPLCDIFIGAAVEKTFFRLAPSKHSDRSAHLIILFTEHILDSQGCKVLHTDNKNSGQTVRMLDLILHITKHMVLSANVKIYTCTLP